MLMLLLTALSSTAQDSTSYRVDLSERDVQQVIIEARFRGVIGETLEFHLPVWRSGQYLIIDPVGTMSGTEVTDSAGSALPFRQTAKSSWQVQREGAAPDAVIVRLSLIHISEPTRPR